MRCRSCGKEVADEASACPSCGTLFPAVHIAALAGADPDPTPAWPADRAANPPAEEATTKVGDPSETAASRFRPGTILADRYRVSCLLGTGAMGEIYRAQDLTLGLPMALKFLPEAQEKNEDRTARLLSEVKIARQVSHPNVCRVYDVSEADGHPFLSMEYIDSENLATLLRRFGRPPPDRAIEVGCEIADGLAAVHREGILHRDLKPANLMIDSHRRVRITDFGIAALAESIHGAEISVGTPLHGSGAACRRGGHGAERPLGLRSGALRDLHRSAGTLRRISGRAAGGSFEPGGGPRSGGGKADPELPGGESSPAPLLGRGRWRQPWRARGTGDVQRDGRRRCRGGRHPAWRCRDAATG